MYTINKNIKNELIIKNSKFITLLIKIKTKDEIESILKEVKSTYPKATHYCYAYKIEKNIQKSSDDGEPAGTAGIPILNVLEKENITNVIAIVIRYFGGIKLGAGGLVRAYTKSVKQAIDQTERRKLIPAIIGTITFPYTKEKEIDHLIAKNQILEKKYFENITYRVIIEKNSNLINQLQIKPQAETYIEQNINKSHDIS